jgi:hypothetical protein
MLRRLFAACAVVASASATLLVAQGGSSEERLKVTHQTLVSAITSGNPAMLESVIHRNGIGFFRDSQMVVQLGGSYGAKEAIPDVLADLGRFTMAAYDTVYRVAGPTGVVCMAMNFQPKKGEKGPPRYIRSTWVYADVDGAWRLVSWHSSDVPLKK